VSNEIEPVPLLTIIHFSAEMEKVIRVVVIKEIKGAQYGVQLENTVRDRLAEEDKYEEEEETELEKVVGFFQSKYFKANSVITYHFSAKDGICEVRKYQISYIFRKKVCLVIHKHKHQILVEQRNSVFCVIQYNLY